METTTFDRQVLIVTGAGGMGKAIARRLGSGKTVLLADFDEATLTAAADELRGDGFAVETQTVDVSQAGSVKELAQVANRLGPVAQLAHTAGVSPVQAPAEAILAVDLQGVALVLDAFGEVIAEGGSGVVISSMGGHTSPPLPPEQEKALATAPSEQLLSLPFLTTETFTDARAAYGFSKYANRLRVQGAAKAWGARGARINTISPGVISTPMGQQELAGPSGSFMREMIAASGTGRIGTTEDIASAAAFLLGPDSTFVTGTDLLVDGGVIASSRSGHFSSAF